MQVWIVYIQHLEGSQSNFSAADSFELAEKIVQKYNENINLNKSSDSIRIMKLQVETKDDHPEMLSKFESFLKEQK